MNQEKDPEVIHGFGPDRATLQCKLETAVEVNSFALEALLVARGMNPQIAKDIVITHVEELCKSINFYLDEQRNA